MSTSLLLDRDSNDICVDASGNIALASEPYSQAQDAASACKLFEGEAWYDTTIGVPYFTQVFRGGQPVQVLKARLAAAAQSVPGVAAATVVLTELTERTLTGQLQLRTDTGERVNVSL